MSPQAPDPQQSAAAAEAGSAVGTVADTDEAARPPWIAGLARLPAALLAPGLLIHLGVAVGAVLPAALAAACALAGSAVGASVAGAAAERAGERAVLLTAALVHVPVLLVLLAAVDRLAAAHAAVGTDLGDQPVGLLLLVGALALLAGVSCPAVPALARLRRWRDRADGAGSASPAHAEVQLETGLRRDVRRDEGALILAPVLLGVLAPMIGSSAGPLVGALIAAVVVPLYAMDPRAATPSPTAEALDAAAAQDDRFEEVVDPPRLPLPGLPQMEQQDRREALPGRSAAESSPAPEDSAPSTADWTSRLPRALVWSLGTGGVLGGLWITLLVGSGAAGPRPGAAWGLAVSAVAAVLAARRPPRRIVLLDAVHRRRLAVAVLLLGVVGLVLAQGAAALLATAAPRLLAVVHGPAQLLAAATIGAACGMLLIELHRLLERVVPAGRMSAVLTLAPATVLAGMSLGLLAGGLLGDLLDAAAPGWAPLAGLVAVGPASLLVVGAVLRR